MVDTDKVGMDLTQHESLQAALLGVFDSQIAGGKRYDLASMGRRRANATYFASHGVDQALGLSYAMDLSPLIHDPRLDPAAYLQSAIQRFALEAADRPTAPWLDPRSGLRYRDPLRSVSYRPG